MVLELPASDERLRYVKDALNIEDFAEVSIESVYCLDTLRQRLIPLQMPDLNLLEELSECLSDIAKSGEEFKMLSVLSMEKPTSLEETIGLAVSLDSYERVRIGEEDYGRSALLELCGDREVIDTVDGFIDWHSFGLYMMGQGGIEFTEYGAIRKVELPHPTMDMGIQCCSQRWSALIFPFLPFAPYSCYPIPAWNPKSVACSHRARTAHTPPAAAPRDRRCG